MLMTKTIHPLIQETAEDIAFALKCFVEIKDQEGQLLGKSNGQSNGEQLKNDGPSPADELSSMILATGQALGEIRVRFFDKREKTAVQKYLNHVALLLGNIVGEVYALKRVRELTAVLETVHFPSEQRTHYSFDDIIGCSEDIKQLKERARRVAEGNSTVLITGETGTGKDVFARSIHFASSRSRGPFISVNCGAIPDNLLESELFGYDRGSFTGALKEGKTGKFELADGGTMFLDEIGEMPSNLQVKLLHVLQNREVERVGGTRRIPVDIRIIAASNRDLEKMMEEKTFRRDLYFRLGVIPLHISPLRERREDVPLLVEHCLRKYKKKLNQPRVRLSPEVMECFVEYPWPGNVREMENALEYAINVCDGSVITLQNLPHRLYKVKVEDLKNTSTLESLMDQYEKKVLDQYLKRFGASSQSKDEIARVLGISRATLYRKLSHLPSEDA